MIQTHLSIVFLTGTRVYKLRKAVDLGFVDFTSRAARNADCLREVHLNRRLAPDVYLGIAPVPTAPGQIHIGVLREDLAPADESGRVPEHCVIMRRLPERRDALDLLLDGKLRPKHVDAVAEAIARLHEQTGLGVPAPFSREQWLHRISEPVRQNFLALRGAKGRFFAAATLTRAARLAERFLAEQADRFEARRRAGRAVDGHGDLHLQHAWFETDTGPPLLIDCLEFSDELRRIDPAADVAFFAMDLLYRGRPRLAERFLRMYARETDDFDLYGVVDYFVSYRAAVRAKVAALVADDAGIETERREAAAGSARRHLNLAARALAPKRRGALVLLCGIVGTGKSSVAELVCDETQGVAIASDRVRKRLAGLAPSARAASTWGGGIYTPEWTKRVYDALLERADPVLASGRVAVLDATFATRSMREAAWSWARARGARAFLIETTCSAPEVLRRLALRERAGRDPSDAGPSLYERSARSFEPPDEWPPGDRFVVATDAPGWRSRARALARDLSARAKANRSA
jgi:aminoglycoside phosphotransferase family enzyme/predicted kinase